MAELDDERTNHAGMHPFDDDEALDDFAPTRIAPSPAALAAAVERSFRPDQVRVGDLLAQKYRVERVHKRGALGVTVEAHHTQLGQRVAIRLLVADPKAYPEAVARFVRGARLAVQHQNEHTARITDVGSLESGSPYIVAEFLSGSDLQRVLRVREWLAVPEAVDYALQACEGLADAHAHDIVHRNLKPTNLFITRRGGMRRLVVLDFGVSEDPLTDAAINLGGVSGAGKSLAYLAPEQIRDPSSVDARADIWALGAILHEMLTGAVLYQAASTPGLLAMIAADPPLPVSHVRPEIPAELESIVLRCLAKDQEERFANVAELASALKPFSTAEGHDSVERINKVFGRRTRDVRPPPLPGHAPTTRAIVHVPQPVKSTPAPAPEVRGSRRLLELGLTAVALAAAGALGVYVAIRSMEGALAAAVAPRTIVADFSPALPAPQPAPLSSLGQVEVAPSATTAPAVTTQAAPARPQPTPTQVPAALAVAPVRAVAPAPAHAASPAPAHHVVAKTEAADAVVADAKPAPRPAGLFDDAN